MILTREEFIESVNNLLPDNSTREISPLDVRTCFYNMVDSVHNFLDYDEFLTRDVRTTIGGDYSMNAHRVYGRETVDNTAYGYASLRSNYNGSNNTSFGSYSLSCNLYGSGNVGVGFRALASNVRGHGNVGVGDYALNNKRLGDYNIAIGHGAGWYFGAETNYTFCVQSTNVSASDLCDENGDPVYSGEPPLLYGDLDSSNHRLAVATKELHDFGVLQVSGDITPTLSGHFNLGNSARPWASVNESIRFSGDLVSVGGESVNSVFEVYKDNNKPSHSDVDYVQSWYCDGDNVLSVGCDGELYREEGFPETVEGVMKDAVNAPITIGSTTSGVLYVRNEASLNIGTIYVVNRDRSLDIPINSYVIAKKINGTYRPIWVSCSGVPQ